MLTSALLVLALGQTPQHRLFLQPNLPRGESYAFFEAFPASGVGAGAACAGVAITGAKGETVTVTRAGVATCSPLGTATSGITNGSLVEVAANFPRVEAHSDGVLGVRREATESNVLTRFIDLTNAAWADVGTPTPTTGQTSPWTGTYATSAVLYDDNDGAAFEGRTQTVTVTAATQYTMCCYVKAGTLTSARLSLDGTTADFTGLSSSTWTLASVTDASSSGVAIAAQVLNGSTAAGIGTVVWGGCQVELGGFCSSMIPTVASTGTRNEDVITAAVTDLSSTTICLAATVEPLWVAATAPAFATAVGFLSPFSALSFPSSGGPRFFTSAGATTTFTTGLRRFRGTDNNTNVAAFYGANTASGAAGSSADRFAATLHIGGGAGGSALDGIVSRIQLDPSPTRCAQ